ncbi:hypothetical protein N4G58_01975 [Edwardsiella piscicida]|nr:hypothetical protein N4G58_01975 [Edwardsiella piscicida]
MSQRDPLFHPVKAGSCRLDKAQARRAIEAQAGMPLADLNRRYGAALAQMDETLRLASSPYCQRHSGEGRAPSLRRCQPGCTLALTAPSRCAAR